MHLLYHIRRSFQVRRWRARARGVGACFCPENLARLLLAAQPHDRLEMLRMPDTMAYPISFGDAKRAYPWSVLADFIRIARAQSPQPA